MELLEKGWFIIFLVIAFIGGNLVALRVTANMKFPRGTTHTKTDSNTGAADKSDTTHDAEPNAANTAASESLPHAAPSVPQPTPSTEQNVTATQQGKAVRKQDHNHNNDLV